MHIASEYSAPRFRRPDSVQVKIGAARQADRSLEAAHEQTAAPIAGTQGPPTTAPLDMTGPPRVRKRICSDQTEINAPGTT